MKARKTNCLQDPGDACRYGELEPISWGGGWHGNGSLRGRLRYQLSQLGMKTTRCEDGVLLIANPQPQDSLWVVSPKVRGQERRFQIGISQERGWRAYSLVPTSPPSGRRGLKRQRKRKKAQVVLRDTEYNILLTPTHAGFQL